MQVLGFSRTWRTHCFINGGCGEVVFAHTNGFGDFVLFDSLGWPWPIHDCYLDRFCQQLGPSGGYQIRTEALEEYRRADETVPRPAAQLPVKDIRRMLASEHLGEQERVVFGYVQDYVENRAERLLRDLGTLGRQHLQTVLGTRRSQITIVTSDFESFTAFADLRNVVVGKKDMVACRLKAVRLLGVPGRDSVFLCEDVLLVRGRPAL